MKIDELTKEYIELRTKKSKMEKIAKERIDIIKTQLADIEFKMLAFLQKTGQESAKTKFGTPYTMTKKSFNIENADDFFNYVIENGAVDLLVKKVNSTTAKSYLADDVKIPGVKLYTEIKVGVKKS